MSAEEPTPNQTDQSLDPGAQTVQFSSSSSSRTVTQITAVVTNPADTDPVQAVKTHQAPHLPTSPHPTKRAMAPKNSALNTFLRNIGISIGQITHDALLRHEAEEKKTVVDRSFKLAVLRCSVISCRSQQLLSLPL